MPRVSIVGLVTILACIVMSPLRADSHDRIKVFIDQDTSGPAGTAEAGGERRTISQGLYGAGEAGVRLSLASLTGRRSPHKIHYSGP